MDTQELLGVAETAALVGRSPRTVSWYAETGKLVPVYKGPAANGKYLFARADIDAFLATQTGPDRKETAA